MGDTLVFGAGLHAVNAGQVHQGHFAAGVQLGFSHAMFDRHAGEVRDFLAEAGQTVEQSRFAGVGWSDNGYHPMLDA